MVAPIPLTTRLVADRPPAVYFDLDDTLVGGHVLVSTFHLLPPRARLGMVLDLPNILRGEARDRLLFNQRLNRHLAGRSRGELESSAASLLQRSYGPHPFPGTDAVLAAYRAVGAEIILVTGSLQVAVAPIAERLGVDHVIANRLVWDQGRATGELHEPVVAGPHKVKLIVDHAAEQGHDLRRCHAWTDSVSDVPMLSVVGRGHVVRPRRKLSRMARLYGWAEVDLSTPLPTLRRSP